MASIRKRSGPRGDRWQVQVRIAGAHQITRTFRSRKAATDFARTTEGAALDGRETGPARLLGEAILRYYETVLPGKTPTTQAAYRRLLEWWYDNHGRTPLAALTRARLVRVRDELAAERDEQGILVRGPATVNRYMATLSSVLSRAAEEWEWLPANPLRRLPKLQEPPGRVRFLDREEIAVLLAACGRRSRELRTYAAITLYTGMRQGEVLALRWPDVDLVRRMIVMNKTKNRDRRGVPISAPLLAELRAHPRRTDTDLLFPMKSNPQRSSRETWRWGWERALRDAGIEGYVYHDSRHSAASHLAMAGASAVEIAAVLGHKTLAMVKRYSHLSVSHLEAVVGRLGAAIEPSPPETSEEDADRAG